MVQMNLINMKMIKMGMFDNIKFEIDCPNCKHKINNFQSKDGKCELNLLEFYQVDRFYSSCDICDTWIEFNLKDEVRKKFTIEDYEMRTRSPKYLFKTYQ